MVMKKQKTQTPTGAPPQPQTLAIHAGAKHQGDAHGVNTPIYPSSAFDYRQGEVFYPRYFNTRNQQVLNNKLAALEGAGQALVLSSGMAAISSLLYAFLKAGDHVLLSNQLYGGTIALLRQEFAKRDLSYSLVDFRHPEVLPRAIQPNTRLLYFETPTNPLLHLVDVAWVADIARQHQLISVVDNTFASPVNQRPLEQGIDWVIHSGTKYLGGHSDLMFGVVAGPKQGMNEVIATAKVLGGNMNALDAYLIERSLKTLFVRVERQNKNALDLARFLQQHPAVQQVHYPGLPEHPQFVLAQRQMYGFGGMLSFDLKENTREKARQVIDRLQLIQVAVSLGGVETLVSTPADTSHAGLSTEERQKMGITDSLIRLSAGLEHPDDLMQDLNQALN